MTTTFKTTFATGILAALLASASMAQAPLGQDAALSALSEWSGAMPKPAGQCRTIFRPTGGEAMPRIAWNDAGGQGGHDSRGRDDHGEHDPIYRPKRDGSSYDRAFNLQPSAGQDAGSEVVSPYRDRDAFYAQGM